MKLALSSCLLLAATHSGRVYATSYEDCTTSGSIGDVEDLLYHLHGDDLHEEDYPIGVDEAIMFSVDMDNWDEYFSFDSKFQSISFSAPDDNHDKCLVLDGTVQICDSYRPHYHEVFVHFPIAYLSKLDSVLIIGGGDAMILHEVLKYPSVTSVVQLELDPDVTRLCEQEFQVDPHYQDKRVDWIFGDAAVTVKRLLAAGTEFDLVVVDISETVVSQTVEGVSFFEEITELVAPRGILIKNEDYQRPISELFSQFLEVQYELPVIVTQSFCLGSHGTSLLLPNWNLFTEANINTTTSFYKPLDNPQHAGMIRHYHQRLHLDERFYSIPKREYFTDEYHMAESGGSAVSNPSGSSGSLDLPISKELGRHKVVEFKNVEALDKLQRLDLLRPAITKTLAAGNMTVVGMSEHQFKPHGVTMLALLTESHFSIHTWPELRFAAVDLFTCGSNVDTSAALRALAAELGVTEYAVRDMARGIYQ